MKSKLIFEEFIFKLNQANMFSEDEITFMLNSHKVDNVEDAITIKKTYQGYYIVSDRCLKLYKCVGITETTATDVIRRIKLMNKED